MRKLIFPRFVSLSLNFTFAVMVYFVTHCILQNEIRWADFVVGLHDFQALGNPTWFILMTLLTYLLTFVSFVLMGEKQPAAFVLILTALIIVSIYLVGRIKPAHWVNTILCFPAGMFYYLKGDQFEATLRKTRIPSIVYAILFMLAGCSINAAGLWPNTYTENLGGILFAVGVTWLVGSFSWKAPSRFLIWLGGSGLFVVYMFHLLPMRIISTLGLNDGNPYLVWLGVTITSAILVFVFYHTYKHLNRLLFSK